MCMTGKQLWELAKEKDLSKTELAAKLGKTEATVKRWIREDVKLMRSTMIMLEAIGFLKAPPRAAVGKSAAAVG